MQDDTVKTGEETLVTPSSDETTVELETTETEGELPVETKTEVPEEPRIPLSRLKEETSKRRELEARLAEMEQRVNSFATAPSDNGTDPDVEAAIEKLTPLLQRKGFTTRQQLEDENNAKAYANEMKQLSKELDGSDGRPAFDAYEVTEWGKNHKVYDLKTAYEKMYEKEIFDWKVKQMKGVTTPETERPSASGVKSETSAILTREAIAKKTAGPGGQEWWEKNREKLLEAMTRGEIQ